MCFVVLRVALKGDIKTGQGSVPQTSKKVEARTMPTRKQKKEVRVNYAQLWIITL